ncbi:hypothetical protein A2380_03830 [candidate division WWE3 bacterium RIFOXYB1_FULL_43_24]|uniref:Polymerase nucleotidyl transferase domain-containing protein n=2 Tax=Katanobacteria TaxID=422282 RepID=A0A0G0YR42_UNCKA|nr:MAG: hypothetical protein UU92_C0003G0023 [candidate division WWE3 bacterium GW2011_GWA1_42_12]KKS35009.1 MAG: hypothetical protein UU97_C0003G0023 [candidate division WWE3 bacterium GW2011_GWD1_42_14]KKS39097.1 MAG: hypothetical protein UV00_C0004G0023 [candidate division WWE3 bacterium GW2011_GWF1_42_14]KKS40627.1 MAG: hypothetical protein UV03_C0004G0023 [candidate division WWE3 bacterium GW2011_GWE1_42_16]KKS67005.1 MAG: hypothetical protein UV35_C0004G0011 [candidate division WWE3 bacte
MAAELEKLINEYVDRLKQLKNNNVLGAVRTGEQNFTDFVEKWSDIDTYVVLESMESDLVSKIIKINRSLSEKYDVHVGLSLLPKNEYYSKNIDINCLKDALMKMNFKFNRSWVIYGNLEPAIVELPNKIPSLVRELNYFKAYLRTSLRDLDGPNLLRACIKANNYILLCALLMEYPQQVDTKFKIKLAKVVFADFDLGFDIHAINEKMKNNISSVENPEEISAVIANYTEDFLNYFYTKYNYV